ncbi:response regulator [Sphingobacterium sp. DN00404]|uniref:histidine kinase n=1 Tax=Sphingobacterium micropteri TaxID=2763501 RepID=A0ABR7YLJ6_9SPHI|nr:two-component regulator propeller domain-containing protein [Sphingobacterium micropteri]MBD1432194.1 response regulator [Sphingobacterium micropteri]
MRKKINLVISILLYYIAASAQENPIHYLGIEHGLSNNNVTKIYQDQTGFMWFGTYDGLNMYDGYTFKSYKNNLGAKESLPDNRITDIVEDHEGLLWVATKNGAAYLSKNQLFFRELQWLNNGEYTPINSGITKFMNWKDKRLFAGTEHTGLLQIKKVKDGRPIGETIPLLSQEKKITRYTVRDVAVDQNHSIWAFVHEHGLCYYDERENILIIKSSDILSGTHMVISRDNDIWVSAENGLHRYDQKKGIYLHYSVEKGLPQNLLITGIYLDKTNKIWITTDGGGIYIVDIDNDTVSVPSKNIMDNIQSQAVYTVYQDNLSRTWIGTLRGGVNIVDTLWGGFKHVQVSPGKNTNSQQNFVLSFSQDKQGGIWIGTDGGGLLHWDRKQNTFKMYEHRKTNLSNNFVTATLQNPDGDVWVGTHGGGINRLDVATGNFKQYKCISPSTGHELRNIWKLFKDSKERIWASTLNRGDVFIYSPAKDSFEVVEGKIYDALTIYEENSSIFWFGSWSTLTRFDLESGEKQEIDIGHTVREIHKGDGNTLWIATEGGGLLKFDKNTYKYQRFTEQDGLSSNTILTILEDSQRNLWLSTYKGLSKFAVHDEKFHNYHKSDGLQSNQFSYNAALKLPSGEMLFGGIRGFNVFHPDSLEQYTLNPPIVLTSFKVNNKHYDLYSDAIGSLTDLNAISMGYEDATLSFSFAALEYSFPDKIKYAYFLEGWDNDWNYVDNQRTALYSGLREGQYTLRIKSTNANGVWNTEEKVVRIEVLPPWWRSGWAYMAYIASGLLLLFIYIRYDRHETKLHYELELVKMKSNQEKELIDKKLAFFTHIAHEFRNPLTLITNPLKEMLIIADGNINKSELTPIYNNSKRLLTLINKLLLFRKTESGFDNLRLVRLDLVKLTNEVYQCFKQHASSKKITYHLDSDMEICEILADQEKLEICLFNLISNAIKYTAERGNVSIKIETVDDRVLVHVKDTGCGISEQGGDRIFQMFQRDYSSQTKQKDGFGIGLFLVKKFAEAHKGSISYQPNKPQGTCFTLALQTNEDCFQEFFVFEDVAEHSVYMEEVLDDLDNKIMYDEVNTHEDIDKEAIQNVTDVTTTKKTMLVVDDNADIRHYLENLFKKEYNIALASSGENALLYIEKQEPDIILSDVVMESVSGIDLCQKIKSNPLLSRIPFILLTASASQEVKLKGIEVGADDYVTKPFNKDILVARVNNLIRSRNRLQDYFYKEITLQKNDYKISSEYKEFLEKTIDTVEQNLDDPDFNVKMLAEEIGMSHSYVYKRIKSISGKSANEFIRFVRLRHTAKQLIDTEYTINEVAFSAGFNDIKYFRAQFSKLFGMNPSEYRKKHQSLKQKHRLNIPKKSV